MRIMVGVAALAAVASSSDAMVVRASQESPVRPLAASQRQQRLAHQRALRLLAASGTIYHSRRGRALGTVLVFYPGGFIVGDSAITAPLARKIAALGYRAVNVEYPLGSLPAAMRLAARDASQASRLPQPVYAVGESSGGTLAGLLAAQHRVRAAYMEAAPTDLLRWAPFESQTLNYYRAIGLSTPQQRAAYSPYEQLSRRSSPMRLYHSPADTAVPYSESRAIVKRAHTLGVDASLAQLVGNHLADQSHFQRLLLGDLRRAPA
jgi:acetyl esterase/lipase